MLAGVLFGQPELESVFESLRNEVDELLRSLDVVGALLDTDRLVVTDDVEHLVDLVDGLAEVGDIECVATEELRPHAPLNPSLEFDRPLPAVVEVESSPGGVARDLRPGGVRERVLEVLLDDAIERLLVPELVPFLVERVLDALLGLEVVPERDRGTTVNRA